MEQDLRFVFYSNNKSLYVNDSIISKITLIKFSKYSLVFNLYLNVLDIKEGWSYFMPLNFNNYEQSALLSETFSNYYYYGFFNYKNLNIFEMYRILVSLLFKYYNNFLYKLSRYLYILSLKNYTLAKFFKRYLNVPN